MNTRVIIICVLGLLYPYCGFGQALNAISGKESLVHTGAGSEKTEKEKYVYHVKYLIIWESLVRKSGVDFKLITLVHTIRMSVFPARQ